MWSGMHVFQKYLRFFILLIQQFREKNKIRENNFMQQFREKNFMRQFRENAPGKGLPFLIVENDHVCLLLNYVGSWMS